MSFRFLSGNCGSYFYRWRRGMMQLVCWLMVGNVLAAWGADHNPLLPHPQKVEYGLGRLPLKGLVIRFATAPAPEDRFAAQQLSKWLSDRTHTVVPVEEHRQTGPAIVLHRTGSVDALPLPDDRPGPESREAYSVRVNAGGANLLARSSAGLFYAVQTVRQMVEGQGDQAGLPFTEIHDWPSAAFRGTMVDEGAEAPQPTEAEIKRQLDFLALWKANQYYFYSEVGIELHGYPLLKPEGRYTQDQVRRIIAYGRERHIDVIPCLELFGHQHDLFRIERYSELADFPHGEEFSTTNPKVMAVLTDWADQFSRLFPSPFVHIGFDEVRQIEMAAKQQSTTPATLFTEFLNKVVDIFHERGKHVMIWGDMLAKAPETANKLPAGLIVVVWSYRPYPDPTYRKWLEPVISHQSPFLVCSAVFSYNQVVPDFHTTFENIDTLLAAGRQSHALGLINTVWGDDLQLLMRMSWAGMAYGAVAPWQAAPTDRSGFFSDYTRIMYPQLVAQDVATALNKLAQAETGLQKVLGEETMNAMWRDPFTPTSLKVAQEHQSDLRGVRLLAEEGQEHLYSALSKGGDSTTLSSLLFGSRLVDYAAQRTLYAREIADAWENAGPHPSKQQLSESLGRGIYTQDQSRIVDLIEIIGELRETYRNEWLAQYTPYRLTPALARWDAELQYWQRLESWFPDFIHNFREGQTLSPITDAIKSVK